MPHRSYCCYAAELCNPADSENYTYAEGHKAQPHCQTFWCIFPGIQFQRIKPECRRIHKDNHTCMQHADNIKYIYCLDLIHNLTNHLTLNMIRCLSLSPHPQTISVSLSLSQRWPTVICFLPLSFFSPMCALLQRFALWVWAEGMQRSKHRTVILHDLMYIKHVSIL